MKYFFIYYKQKIHQFSLNQVKFDIKCKTVRNLINFSLFFAKQQINCQVTDVFEQKNLQIFLIDLKIPLKKCLFKVFFKFPSKQNVIKIMSKAKNHFISLLFIVVTISHFQSAQCLSWIQLFGMQDLVTDLVKAQPIVHYTGQESVSYAVDDRLMNFLKNFKTRTDFCDYKCPSFYQVPCFILFKCNIQIRNFVIIIIVPLILIALIGICCGRGIWTFGCWGKYIGLLTGIFFIIWFMKKFIKGYQIVQRRKRQRQYLKQQRQMQQIEIEPVYTQKRLNQQS